MRRPYHIYECRDCIMAFAVEQEYEDQSEIQCPDCGRDDGLADVGHGEMVETHYPVEEGDC